MKVIKFSADWCQPCKVVDPILKSLTQELNLSLESINVSSQRPLFEKYGVKTVPTIIVEEEGQEVKRHTGMISKNKLRDFLTH